MVTVGCVLQPEDVLPLPQGLGLLEKDGLQAGALPSRRELGQRPGAGVQKPWNARCEVPGEPGTTC